MTYYHLSDLTARRFHGRASLPVSALMIAVLASVTWLAIVAAAWGFCRFAGL